MLRRRYFAAAATSTALLVACAPLASDSQGSASGDDAGYRGPRLETRSFDVPCEGDNRGRAGTPAVDLPPVVLYCLGPGPAVDITTLTGQATVINFWASWCDPCREEMPMLASVADDAGREVRFVGVNTKDDPQDAAEFLDDTGVRFEQLYDPDAELLRQLRTVQGLPITLVLDAAGVVVLKHIGQIDEDTLVAALDDL